MHSFKKRWHSWYYKLHGKSSDVIEDDATKELPKLMEKIRKYKREHVYNCDESRLFYQKAPDRTIATGAIIGRKAQKSRFNFLSGCNEDGSDRLPLFCMGTPTSQKCLKKKCADEMGLPHASNEKACITGSLFSRCLAAFNNRIIEK